MLRWKPSAAVLAFVALSGCNNNDDGIRTYTVPKTTEPALPVKKVEPITGGDVRLLGALIPTGERSPSGESWWFVKFVGPVETVSAAEKDFDAFLASMKIVPNAETKKLEWTLPAGWKQSPGARQMRTATFLVGPAGKTVELYISTPMGGDLLENINRWRDGDAGMPKIPAEKLPECTREITIDGVKALRVDLTGPGPVGGKKKMGPFQGGMGR